MEELSFYNYTLQAYENKWFFIFITSQNIKYTVLVTKLEQVFNLNTSMKILRQHGYNFEFRNNLITNSKGVFDEIIGSTISEILVHFLRNIDSHAFLIFTGELDRNTPKSRLRLFGKWFRQCNIKHNNILAMKHVPVKSMSEYKDAGYSVIYLKGNPLKFW